EARRRQEAQVRSLAEGQSRLLAIVENLSGDTDRQFSSSSQAKAEALATVERVVGTVEELRRTVDQDGDVVNARLREHGLAIDETRRSVAEDLARLRAAQAENQRQSAETASRQRQGSDELATTAASVAATRQELAELSRLVQGLDRKLGSWKGEVKVEVLEEVAGSHSLHDSDRLKLDSLHREITQMAATRIDLESRIERLKVEIATSLKSKPDAESHLREVQSFLTRRLDDVEFACENLRSELSTATATRIENLEARSQEALQSLSRRFDALQVAAAEDVESARLDIKKLSSSLKWLEDSHGSHEKTSSEIRSALAAVQDASAQNAWQSSRDALRSEITQKVTDLVGRVDQLEFELTSTRATRESFEYRVRDSTAETRQSVDLLKGDVTALSHRISSELEDWKAQVQEEFQLQRVLKGELAEVRAFFKEEQTALAALDEQLWLTDQRLGQRIDELLQEVQAGQRGERLAASAWRSEKTFDRERLSRRLEPCFEPTSFAESDMGAQAHGSLSMVRQAAETLAEHGGLDRR
ncbi:unnamed protein product, partial [Effrenium voratum]